MTLRFRFIAAFTALAIACACSGDTDPLGRGTNDSGGNLHAPLPSPITITEGSYETKAFEADEFERAMEAEATEGPSYRGTINGITVDPDYESRCPAEWTRMTDADVDSNAIPLPTNFPPGTVQRYAQEGWRCMSDILWVNRVFEMTPADVEVGITRLYNVSTLDADAGSARVSSGSVQGRPAVFVAPLLDSGYGNSWIAFKDGPDLIRLVARNLRFADLRAIAESYPL